MPVSVALGLGPQAWVEAAGGPAVAPDRLALVGFRDQAEALEYGMRQPQTLEPAPIQRPVEALRAAGPGIAATDVASTLADKGPFWLHLDVDVLDQNLFPATDYLMPNGLTWDELAEVLPPLLTSPSLIGTSLGCYNPDKDAGNTCGRTLVETLSRGLSR
jgi:arginase